MLGIRRRVKSEKKIKFPYLENPTLRIPKLKSLPNWKHERGRLSTGLNSYVRNVILRDKKPNLNSNRETGGGAIHIESRHGSHIANFWR